MKTCTLTPNRGNDRAVLLQQCKHYLKAMSAQAYVIDYPPRSAAADLVPRVQHGIELAKRDGYEYCFIIESDDYYPTNYLSHFTPGSEFYGFDNTTYYNIRNCSYSNPDIHRNRASLFATGFKISALDAFRWPPNDTVFLDINLWSYASQKRRKVQLHSYTNPAVGIKHNIDKVGGKGHRGEQRNKDVDFKYLKSRVDSEALQFYTNLHNTLNA